MGKKKSKTQKFKKNKKRKARRINVDKVVNPLILVEKGGKIMFKSSKPMNWKSFVKPINVQNPNAHMRMYVCGCTLYVCTCGVMRCINAPICMLAYFFKFLFFFGPNISGHLYIDVYISIYMYM